VPVVPSCIIDWLRDQFLALVPAREDHRLLGPDALVFDRLFDALGSKTGYEHVADRTCSATTIRRRGDERSGLERRLTAHSVVTSGQSARATGVIDLALACVEAVLTDVSSTQVAEIVGHWSWRPECDHERIKACREHVKC
jgi:hypothetical protein